MRRMTYFVMALALVLGFTQCKKEQTNENNNTDEGEKVTITLNVDNGFSKGHVTPGENIAPVVYDDGDIIMVGYNGACVGDLTYNGTAFTGTINATPSGSQPLHFYYLSGLSWTVTNNQCTVDISDQSSRQGIISYGTSTDDFVGEGTYSAYLLNQCALVKFVCSSPSSVTLTGMKNEATINFAANTVTSGVTGDGDIKTKVYDATTHYAIVLSDQKAVSGPLYEGNGTFSIPTDAFNNAFLTGNITINP